MRIHLPLLLCGAAMFGGAMPAAAAPAAEPEWLAANGDVSRRAWLPAAASADWGGVRVSAGVALGLQGAVQANLGRTVAPTLTMSLGTRSQLHLLPAAGRGAMLVLQTTP